MPYFGEKEIEMYQGAVSKAVWNVLLYSGTCKYFSTWLNSWKRLLLGFGSIAVAWEDLADSHYHILGLRTEFSGSQD